MSRHFQFSMKMTRLFCFFFSPVLTLLKNSSNISLLIPSLRVLMEAIKPCHFEDSSRDSSSPGLILWFSLASC